MGDCFLIGHGGYALPKLDLDYPKDVTLTSYNAEAVFQVKITKNGRPKKYTYKWYFSEDEGKTFKEVSSGQDKDTLLISGYNGDQEYQVYCEVTNRKGTVKSRTAKMNISVPQPLFTYMVNNTNQANNPAYVIKDGWNTNNWKLKFLQSGILTFTNRGTAKNGLDIFLVGGGAGGTNAYGAPTACGGAGGGGGRTKTVLKESILRDTQYQIEVGAGGEVGTAGKPSKFGSNILADGGSVGSSSKGGNGGSGGGAGGQYWHDRGYWKYNPGNGGEDGENGGNSKKFPDETQYGGEGLDSTTYEFWENSSNALYAGGGAGGQGYEIHLEVFTDTAKGGAGGGGDSGKPGTANTGGGGGGGNFGQSDSSGKPGGSGIVIIRNARS